MRGSRIRAGDQRGGERYAQIIAMAETPSERLEGFIVRHQPDAADEPNPIVVADRNARWRAAAR
jgi:hypothetical protein